MKYRRLLCLFSLLLSFSLMGFTCIARADPEPTPVPAAPTVVQPVIAFPTTPVLTPTPTPEPQPLAFGIPAAPPKLDPAVTRDTIGDLISTQIYDTLTRFSPGTTTIEPGLAIHWQVSNDGLTWDFTLREDVTFHDGTPLTAETVVWNFKRWMDPDHPAHKGDFLFWAGMFGGTLSKEDQETNPGLVSAVEAVNERTFRLVLTKPFAPLLHNLALPAFAILSPTAVLASDVESYGTPAGQRPVGTGPFQLTDWQPDQITLMANADYWAGPPLLSQLTFKIISDDNARFAALNSGAIQGMLYPTLEHLQQAQADPQIEVLLDPQPTTAFLNFNFDDEHLSQLEIRQAIAYAINKEKLVAETFGPTWKVATQMLPPAIWGYNDFIEPIPYDPVQARAFLEAAQLSQPLKVELWYPDRPRPYLPRPEETARAIARDLEAIGIDVRLETEDWSAYLVDRSNGVFSTWLLGWTGYNGDPDSFFFYHFSEPTPREGNYTNEELRNLLLRGQVHMNPEMRKKIYQRVAVILHQELPKLFLAHPQEPILLAHGVAGLIPNPAGPESFWRVRRHVDS